MKYIYHHLGLGDHIICNGLVRSLVQENEQYLMFVKPHNLTSVKFMYRDLKNMEFIVGDDSFVNQFITEKKITMDDIIKIGFSNNMGSLSWDEFFYFQHGINFSKRWNNFFVLRDFESEKNLFKKLNPQNLDFILIHSKGSDNIDRINYEIINKKYLKIFVDKYTDNIFDFLYLCEKAIEIHCVESSFHVLVDSIKLNKNIFFHTKSNGRGFQHKINKNWKVV